MKHCSFCRRASRALVFSNDDVAVCGPCAVRAAQHLSAMTDDARAELFQLEQRDPTLEVTAMLDESRRRFADELPGYDRETQIALAVAYTELGLHQEAIGLAAKLMASSKTSDPRLADAMFGRFPRASIEKMRALLFVD